MPEPLLSVSGLSKTITLHILGGRQVQPLRDVSFDLHPGEFLAIAGPSGAGKSSLLKCLNRTYLASAGTANYTTSEGETVDLLAAPEREMIRLRQSEVHYVPQFLKAPPRVPAIDVVAARLVRQGADVDEARGRAASILERLRVGPALQTSYPALFSGGEQQRVNVAQAFIAPPRLLLLDEPTSALDMDNRDRVVELLHEAQAGGTAVIAIFHDRELIRRLADRVLVLADGLATEFGPNDDFDPTGDIVADELLEEVSPVSSVAIVHGNIVLPDSVLEDGAVLVQDGRITEIGPCREVSWSDADEVLDADHRFYVLPGLIDTHCDGLEVEINPRPRVNFDGAFAMRNYERRCLMGGVTTSFHALMFANMARSERTIADAARRAELIRAAFSSAAMDHGLLHRCDVWAPEALDLLVDSLRASRVQAISLNDHTPGQGQYRNLDEYKKTMLAYHASDPAYDAEKDIATRMAARQEDTTTVRSVLDRVATEYRREPFVLASHDDDSVEKVDAMHEIGCTIAEFPVVIEAARRARELGEWITVGAPNIVRGGSTSGNADATALVREGFADIICADYHTPSMLVAAFKLVDLGICSLPEAIAKVTANPAVAFGLSDRGRIEIGLSGDLALVERLDGRPLVHAALYRGAVVYADGQAQRVEHRTMATSHA